MQCWKFFKKPENKNEEIPESVSLADRYPLYALTANKKFAKRFMKERNMSKFILKKSEVDKEEYGIYANRHRGTVLDVYKYLTSNKKHAHDNEKYDVEILSTLTEKQAIEEISIDIFDENWWEYIIPTSPFVYKNNILEALKRFDFVSCHKLYLAPDFMMEDSDDYSAPDGYVDEFEFFIYMFKDLFN